MALFSFFSNPEWFHVLVLIPLLFFMSLLLMNRWKKGGIKLPPTPQGLPIIGNMHQLGKLPHNSLWNLSQKYGPFMLLKLGTVPTLVVSSADAAKEILKTHDVECSSRLQPPSQQKFCEQHLYVGLAPTGNIWKERRKIFASELLGSKMAPSIWHAREEEIKRLIDSLLSASPSSPVNLNDLVFACEYASICTVAFGRIYVEKKFKNQKFKDLLDEANNLLESFSAEDYFPAVGRIVDYLRGLCARLDKSSRDRDGYLKMVLDDHRDPARPKPEFEDFVDVLLRLSKEKVGSFSITDDLIKSLVMETFLAGLYGNVMVMVWVMSELVRKPQVLKKVQTEIRSCVGRKPMVDRDDLPKLTYLKMVVKETLRLHPPTPLLTHMNERHFKIGGDEGYDILPKTSILINAWGIARDPKCWQNPEEFYPERFEDNDIDFRGRHSEFLPFGAGRRICAGLEMAVSTVEFTIANLLHCFDWALPDGMKSEDISMEEVGGVVIYKKTPLCLVPIKYNWKE